MTGKEYLQEIRANLELGRNQHRMGENILRAFGYVRRRATAIKHVNATLEELGLVADPPINSEMPLRLPRTRFSLRDESDAAKPETVDDPPTLDSDRPEAQDDEDDEIILPEPAFSVSELVSADRDVECVSPSSPIEKAYTTMLLHKYSQLVVADSKRPRQQDIKGIVSFQSLAKALMNGKPKTVGECIDSNVTHVQSDADLRSVVSLLSGNDVVLVIGRDKRLQGLVTAWDLADEFAQLVEPFNRIGEIEERLRTLGRMRLGKERVGEFLKDHGFSGKDPTAEIEELTMGELQRVLEFPEHWDALEMTFDRVVFIDALGKAVDYRNRLMHFRDPLTEDERTHLINFCDIVREIQLDGASSGRARQHGEQGSSEVRVEHLAGG